MDSKAQRVQYKGNRNISINILPGHFATNHSHVNFYVDMTTLKTQFRAAKLAAEVLVEQFGMTTPVDTILCLEGTEMIGAFVAEGLAQTSLMAMNSGADIHVLTPELNTNNQLVFQRNTQHLVTGKSVLLLLSSVTTGKTIRRAVDCLQYYQGQLLGIGALFSAAQRVDGMEIRAIFSAEDLPQYKTYLPNSCEMCRQSLKMDAIVNSMGYTPL